MRNGNLSSNAVRPTLQGKDNCGLWIVDCGLQTTDCGLQNRRGARLCALGSFTGITSTFPLPPGEGQGEGLNFYLLPPSNLNLIHKRIVFIAGIGNPVSADLHLSW